MNEIIISNIPPQDIVIGEGGATGITSVLVNGVDVTVGNTAYVVVPTKTSELLNDSGFITEEQDPTVPYYIKEITKSDINKWNNKQDMLVSGQNIKTINNDSLLGSGNINIDTSYTAGTGINITDENVINNIITSYNDLSDLPTIPTKTSDLQNDSGFVSSEDLSSVAFTGDYDDLINTPDLSEFITRYTNELVNYYTKDFFFNILPKVTGTGTSINLNNTAKGSQMYLTLGATELSQDATPTPSSPQDIHTISGSNTIKVNNGQLFNKNDITSGKWIKADGSITAGVDEYGYSNYISIMPNENYYVSGMANKSEWTPGYCFYDKNKTYISGVGNGNREEYGFTAPSNAKYFIFSFKIADLDTIMLNAGNSALPYKSYITSQEQEIDLNDIEYCKIGSYEDKFIRQTDGTWELEKNIGKVVLDGSDDEYWSVQSTNYFRSGNIIPNLKIDELKSNIGTYISLSNLSVNTDNRIAPAVGNRIWCRFSQFNNDLEAFKTYLSTNNMIVKYPLATPTYTPITGTLAEQLENIYQNMLSEQTQTNISQVNADLPFTITATTLKDLSSL